MTIIVNLKNIIYFELIFMFQLFYFKVGSSFFITCLYLLNVSLSFLEKASFIILLFSALLRLSFLDSFRSYLKFNEVPFFALFWIISATIWAFIEGDLAHPIGKIAFGLALLVVGGVIVIIYWGLQSAATVSRALNESLEKGWQTLIPAKMQKQSQKKFTAKALLGPFFNRHFDVQRTTNIRYGDAGERNLLDVYRSRLNSFIRGQLCERTKKQPIAATAL